MKETILAVLPAALPTLSVLIALLVNQVAINRLASDVRDLRGQVNGMNDRLNDRINSLDQKLGERIDNFGKQLHEGIVMLVGRDTETSARLARLEERNNG